LAEILSPEASFDLLAPSIQRVLKYHGLEHLTEIQGLAIPSIIRGDNVLLIAPTGTGKTFAALLPIFHLFLARRATRRGISIVYVTPLRALNRDLLRRLIDIGRDLEVDIQIRHGDTVQTVRATQARKPPDMLITTPETLQAILPGRKMRLHLSHVRWLVVDEIHELAKDKRGAQLSLALERMVELAGEFQRIGLSATVGDAETLASFLVGTGRPSVVVRADETKDLSVRVECPSPSVKDAEEGQRLGLSPASIARLRRIAEIVQSNRSSLVFTNTREHAEALGSQLKILYPDLQVAVHHGSLSREIREAVENEFQSGTLQCIVCTSSLELGVDIGDVAYVMQYMSPRQATKLIHRVGRSGHKVGQAPRGSIICNSADDVMEAMVLARRAGAGELEPIRIHDMALDVLAHQMVGAFLENRSRLPEDLLRIARRAYPYRDLQADHVSSILSQLQAQRLLRIDGTRIRLGRRAFEYYFENLSMIPDVKQYTVFDFFTRKRIGALDQEFVARRCKPGAEFIMHGQTWKVIAVKEDELSIHVEPSSPSLNAIPSWEGEIIPVEFQVAMEVGSLRKLAQAGTEALPLYEVDQGGLAKARETVLVHCKNYPLPSDKAVLIERFENCVVIHGCFGNRVNEALATAISAVLAARIAVSIATQTDAYRIALISPIKLDPHVVAKELTKMRPEDLERIIQGVMEETDLYLWRHWQVAKRFGVVERRADYNHNRAKLLAKVFRRTHISEEACREILVDKLDLENAREIVRRISMGEISVHVANQKAQSCSPLATPILDKILPNDILRPALPSKPIIEILRERLESQEVRLVCIFNADWEGIRSVRTLPEKFACPKCRSTLIALTYRDDEDLLKIAKKRKRGQSLSPAEDAAWTRGWMSASLLQAAGKKAVLAMAARGVGPVTASRILRRPSRSEDELLIEVLKAEREYARTRAFWD